MEKVNVGLVLISHSYHIVQGLKRLIQQIEPNVQIACSGGANGDLGTNMLEIKDAIQRVHSPMGTVILFDLGSALLNAEMAIEMLGESGLVRIADAPLVEGAYAAAIEAGCGSSLDEVVAAAESTKQLNKLERS
ncbi:dihydroxyacetone kinase phosphoryl donor subunit DhaM [Bacillus horti]|uniref:phosphoenolpyruvate--glycerone phosphotransferase n=1 Tax=Caldalkalibacillus horti TaxID=77523 RepID=A0ABT9W4Z8_9BACI|nr:dihydroxyacetone kinase phosphoryl donor subunit DhaM [Bacillus horti]MDQ0168328.1 dihydroxyacetone kinase phosphotransfer subunit [Bacillus horti]